MTEIQSNEHKRADAKGQLLAAEKVAGLFFATGGRKLA
jgi:hypothetical protein